MSAVILPLYWGDMQILADLQNRAEDLANTEFNLERRLRLVRAQKADLELRIADVLKRRPKCYP